jgi:hypothetical protein
MDAREITLNISVNLGRLSRWAMDGRKARLDQFLAETADYVKSLDSASKSARFMPTYEWFKKDFDVLSKDIRKDADWAESMLTWANILSHRAQLNKNNP